MTDSAAIKRLSGARMYIGGEWRAASDGGTVVSIDPATEAEIARFPDATADDVDAAVQVAKMAARSWAAKSPLQRAALVSKLADQLVDHAAELAEIDAIDAGNPIRAMHDDVLGAAREMRMFAGLATEIKGDSVLNGEDQFAYGVYEPYGVVGRIIAFNHPLKFAAGKSASALIAGNTVVLKPSEHASLSAIRLAELAHGILPPGVFNVVTGRGEVTGAALAAHPGVPRVAFTGGINAGRAVLRAGVDSVKHVTVELSGKNPMIVFPDVDPAKAAAAAVKGMNLARSQGQSCQSTSRIYVHADIRDAFTEELLRIVRALRVGNPLADGTDLGPLAFRGLYEKVVGYIEKGREEGATLLTGGKVQQPGYFVEPTVFADVQQGMAIARDEIFGPVMSILTWTDYETMIDQANDTPFGLTANIWTNDLRLAHKTAHRIEAGYVWINGAGKRVTGTPFGGFKHSGLGKESSLEEMLEYCRLKTVAVGIQAG